MISSLSIYFKVVFDNKEIVPPRTMKDDHAYSFKVYINTVSLSHLLFTILKILL